MSDFAAQEEGGRRRTAIWFFLGVVAISVLLASTWMAFGGTTPLALAGRPVASPSPTAGSPVIIAPGGQAASATTVQLSTTGNGNGSGQSNSGHSITASGTVQGQVGPGSPATMVVTINNPNNQDIVVTSVSGSVTAVTSAGNQAKPTCSTAWYHVGSFSGSRTIAKNASGAVTLLVTFDDLMGVNQDNCKSARYTYTFTVEARQA